ncbi:alpha/beta hydrolase [Rhodococcus sp. 105337]|uniref:alpha/beta fold hydrolase n=1 Tax=unclassified Rhodococcus (in: high G+C Gram-positive bacteria) TaxID=192944 RepID=UPI00146D929E|nr:alpha/beta hydrolase [Rhodococcus sp. 105337]NME81061.1 alpha/beta hydrolase [Rhodococcus sp. 105337]
MGASTIVPGRNVVDDERREPILCVHDGPGVTDHFADQIRALAALPIGTQTVLDIAETDSLERWLDEVTGGFVEHGRSHLLATGPAAYGAIVFATRRPELVLSLLLGDPAVPSESEDYRDLLRTVVAPTLVIASVPEAGDETCLEQPQTIAGGIDNGVFVVIDGCRVPAHQERPTSFNEWVTSFTIIAEGLADSGAPPAYSSNRQENPRA